MTDERPGFEETPPLPESEYRVHDPDRPHPKPVNPAGPVVQPPPADATILFDGDSLEGWEAVSGGEPAWTVEDDELVVNPDSGVFLADRYELQILDCAETAIYADGWTGAVYGQQPPLVDACRPSGAWQSFDIVWRRPRFHDGSLRTPARLTVLHNGILIHESTEPVGPTTYRDFHEYEPHGPAPLRLQDHGFPVRFRNLWYRPV